MTFPYTDLPTEIQTYLLYFLDLQTLAKVCRLNKRILALANPLLWREIDFKTTKTETERWDFEASLQHFFLTCYLLRETRLLRWQQLAGFVQYLRLVKVPDMQIGYWAEQAIKWKTEEEKRDFKWGFPTPPDPEYYRPQETVWDIICFFHNLEELHIYIQQDFEHGIRDVELAQKMRGALPHLRRLKIGGDVDKEMMLGLLSTAHQSLEYLSCTALQDGTAGQDYHSRGLLFLEEVSATRSFPKLNSLHLCKLAELFRNPLYDENNGNDEFENPQNEESGLRWQWEVEDDLNSLKDWATFIQRTSSNLEILTLEDAYLVGGYKFGNKARKINPGGRYCGFPGGPSAIASDCQSGETESEPVESELEAEEEQELDPITYGAASRLRFRQTLLPVLAEQAWPKLRKLVLVGLALPGDGDVNQAEGPYVDNDSLVQLRAFLSRLSSDHVEVELRPAGIMQFVDELTPLNVSPAGSWYAG